MHPVIIVIAVLLALLLVARLSRPSDGNSLRSEAEPVFAYQGSGEPNNTLLMIIGAIVYSALLFALVHFNR
jgi:hypothetical protein